MNQHAPTFNLEPQGSFFRVATTHSVVIAVDGGEAPLLYRYMLVGLSGNTSLMLNSPFPMMLCYCRHGRPVQTEGGKSGREHVRVYSNLLLNVCSISALSPNAVSPTRFFFRPVDPAPAHRLGGSPAHGRGRFQKCGRSYCSTGSAVVVFVFFDDSSTPPPPNRQKTRR